MSLAAATRRMPIRVHFETPNLLVRTLTVDDASDRWAAWFDQQEVRDGLNLRRQARTKADIEAYIRKFDQVSRLLLGIFDRKSGLLIGFLTVEIDWTIGRYLANTVVGEEAYRHRGVLLEISPPFRAVFFDELKLKVMTASALATNKAIITYLEGTGWTRNQTLKGHARSHKDGAPIDLHLYSLTREAWEAWMAANPDMLARMTNGLAHLPKA